jgi:hypothetical protein
VLIPVQCLNDQAIDVIYCKGSAPLVGLKLQLPGDAAVLDAILSRHEYDFLGGIYPVDNGIPLSIGLKFVEDDAKGVGLYFAIHFSDKQLVRNKDYLVLGSAVTFELQFELGNWVQQVLLNDLNDHGWKQTVEEFGEFVEPVIVGHQNAGARKPMGIPAFLLQNPTQEIPYNVIRCLLAELEELYRPTAVVLQQLLYYLVIYLIRLNFGRGCDWQ